MLRCVELLTRHVHVCVTHTHTRARARTHTHTHTHTHKQGELTRQGLLTTLLRVLETRQEQEVCLNPKP